MQRPEFPRLSVNSSLKRTNKERSGATIGFIALVKYLLLTAHFPVVLEPPEGPAHSGVAVKFPQIRRVPWHC